MKVADAMSKHVDFVTTDATVEDVSRLIFGRGINGVPVCRNKKVVGFIIERDILAQFYPSMQEYIEDPVHARDFEGMEGRVSEILALKVEKIMSKNPTTVTPDTPLLQAQSLMSVHKVGRLPVVDGKGTLLGILSRGDIFRAVVGKKMPYIESEEYHDWIAKHYDLAIGWESRLELEIKALTTLFKRNKTDKILDIGCGTGEHAIALARNGFHVVGMENSRLMFKTAKDKWDKLPRTLQERVKFIEGEYVGNLKKMKEQFGAAIFMGNALAHIPQSFKAVLKELNKVLLPRNAFIIAQLVNFQKVFRVKNRLHMFVIRQSILSPVWEHAYFWFYDPPRERGGLLTLNAVILDFNGKIWTNRGMTSVKIAPLTKEKIGGILKKVGFPRISFYGIKTWGPLLKQSFKTLESDWLNVVAKR